MGILLFLGILAVMNKSVVNISLDKDFVDTFSYLFNKQQYNYWVMYA